MGKEVVLIYSGGLDSTVGLYLLRNQGYDVYPLSINYGQRHLVELSYARMICKLRLGIEDKRVEIDISRLGSQILKGSSQTDPMVDVPEGHYEDPGMESTVVPNRNAIMLTLAAGYAVSKRIDKIAYCSHMGDWAVYPDCRPEFIQAMSGVLSTCHFYPIELMVPFQRISKTEIVRIGQDLGVPFDLTYSCYKGGQFHCGRCSTCVERREAFHLAGVGDLTPYEDPSFWKTVIERRP